MQSDEEIKYRQTLENLFSKLQAFHRVGAVAYKPGLQNIKTLAQVFGNPQRRFKTIHIAGTNGKGSTAHLLASVFIKAGYKTGLYTSPHLFDFAERIRINGTKITHERVVDFVERFESMHADVDPSFFELTTMMAFDYFARENVDIAIIEVGLGGRLDATNIIRPELSIVTNISLDHTGILGSTTAAIAHEKAGIFKKNVPALVGEADEELRKVFCNEAALAGSPLTFVEDNVYYEKAIEHIDNTEYIGTPWGTLSCPLTGIYQTKNVATVLCALSVLGRKGYKFDSVTVRTAFAEVCSLTGLCGRWQTLRDKPHVICDTGHNPGAWHYLAPRLIDLSSKAPLSVVLGFVNDKDYGSILRMLPHNAHYFITAPSTPRAASCADVLAEAKKAGLDAEDAGSVADAVKKAVTATPTDGYVFIGGSNFVVAEVPVM